MVTRAHFATTEYFCEPKSYLQLKTSQSNSHSDKECSDTQRNNSTCVVFLFLTLPDSNHYFLVLFGPSPKVDKVIVYRSPIEMLQYME